MAEGYGQAARPLDDVIQEVVADRKKAQPTIVWFCDPADEDLNIRLEDTVLNDEDVAIALKRFACLQCDVSTIPPGKLKDDLTKSAPVIYLYDPAGKSFARIEGKQSTSRTSFYAKIGKLWSASYKTRLRDFTRKMTSNLDKLEKLEGKLVVVEVKRSRAAGSTSRLRAIEREEKKLQAEEKKLLEEQQKIIDGCVLKEEFTSGEPATEE